MTATTNQNQYFDLHLKGVGYINRFREVQPRNKKSQPFCAVTIGFLRGDADEVEYTYVDTIIRNKEVCEILKQHQDAINDKNSKVLGIVTASDIYAEVYESSNDGPKAGIKGRLIGMRQLKINGEIVFSKLDDSDSEGQFSEDQNDEPVNQDEASEPAEVSVEQEVLAPEVQLDPNAPDFAVQRDHLKELGYAWSRDKKAWVLAA